MKRLTGIKLAVLIATVVGTSLAQTPDAGELLRDCKRAAFRQHWNDLLRLSRDFQDRFPGDRQRPLALYYEARSLEGLDRREGAVDKYSLLLKRPGSVSHSLLDDARLSRADLAIQLFESGKTGYRDLILDALGSREKSLRHLAALRVDPTKDDKIRKAAVSVLQEILRKNDDEFLRSRALVRLLSIDPKLARDLGRRPALASNRKQLEIEWVEDGESTKISLPFSLARLIFSYLPRSVASELEKEGIQPDTLISQLEDMKSGDLIEVRSGDSFFRIRVK